MLEELPEAGERRSGGLHREYLWAEPPTRGRRTAKEEGAEKACAGYRMRMLTSELWRKWRKIRLHLSRPEMGLDGTNNATERAIGKSKVRYESMRGYESVEGMKNGIVLTQWPYSGEDEVHDLVRSMAA